MYSQIYPQVQMAYFQPWLVHLAVCLVDWDPQSAVCLAQFPVSSKAMCWMCWVILLAVQVVPLVHWLEWYQVVVAVVVVVVGLTLLSQLVLPYSHSSQMNE